jgi:uncharacterized membrane protein
MSLRTTLLVALVGVGALLALLLGTHEWGLGQRADGQVRWKYLLEDVHDRNVYQQRGRWLPGHLAPYVEEHSEYPQLATYLLGVPYLFFDSHVPVGRTQTLQEFRAHPEDMAAYFDLHHVVMAVGLLLLILLTALALRDLGAPPAGALLLFLPCTLYYSFNRFDTWPSLMVVGALLCQFRGRPLAAATLLALGAMTKWYPVLLLPLFLSHNLYAGDDRRPWLRRVPRAVLLPGLVAAAVCAAFLALTWVWHDGGLEAVKYVYGPRGQGDRAVTPGSVIHALTAPDIWGWFGKDDLPWLARLGTLSQFLPALGMAFVPLRNRRQLVLACLFVVLGFIQFGKVFSPQWIVWVAPLAILAGRPAMLLLVLADLVTWLQVPLFFYECVGNPEYTGASPGLKLTITLRIVVLVLFWAWSFAAFLRTVRRPEPAVG